KRRLETRQANKGFSKSSIADLECIITDGCPAAKPPKLLAQPIAKPLPDGRQIEKTFLCRQRRVFCPKHQRLPAGRSSETHRALQCQHPQPCLDRWTNPCTKRQPVLQLKAQRDVPA